MLSSCGGEIESLEVIHANSVQPQYITNILCQTSNKTCNSPTIFQTSQFHPSGALKEKTQNVRGHLTPLVLETHIWYSQIRSTFEGKETAPATSLPVQISLVLRK